MYLTERQDSMRKLRAQAQEQGYQGQILAPLFFC